jgi:hypothetical protein
MSSLRSDRAWRWFMAGACRSLTFNAQARYAISENLSSSDFATGPSEPAGRGDKFSERLSNGERLVRGW